MKPILIAPPRSGSTVACDKLFNIAKDNFDYRCNLYEFFNINKIVQSMYSIENNEIVNKLNVRVYTEWYQNKFELQKHRLNLLKQTDGKYMIKVLSFELIDEVIDYIFTNYDPIFLERENKIDQFLSWLVLYTPQRKAHHTKYKHLDVIKELHYHKDYLNDFIFMLQEYDRIKHKYELFLMNEKNDAYDVKKLIDNRTLIYEDICTNLTESTIATSLHWTNIKINDYESVFYKTPYKESIVENLIVNRQDWDDDKLILLNYKNIDLTNYKTKFI